ncbi:MAG: SRPBCC family protein [Promethearchaeota archaeon]
MIETEMEAPIDKVFAFLSDPRNGEKTLPEEAEGKIELLSDGPIGLGTRYRFTGALGGRKIDSVAEIVIFEKNKRTVEKQIEGDMKKWEESNTYEVTDKGTKVTSTIDYALPYSVLGKIIDKLVAGKQIKEYAKTSSERAKQILEEKYLLH